MNQLPFFCKIIFTLSFLAFMTSPVFSFANFNSSDPVTDNKCAKYSKAVYSFVEGKNLGDLVTVTEGGLIELKKDIFLTSITKEDIKTLNLGVLKTNNDIQQGKIELFKKDDVRLTAAAIAGGCCKCSDCPCGNSMMNECCNSCFLWIFCWGLGGC